MTVPSWIYKIRGNEGDWTMQKRMLEKFRWNVHSLPKQHHSGHTRSW
jgi:hypothetical protein